MSVAFKNILANYGTRIWGFISIYIFTPLYISLLGNEAYGIISFYAVVMGVITLADVGIVFAIDREFAKNSSDEHKLGILFFFEKIYFGICVIIILAICVLADIISKKWLQSVSLTHEDITTYIRLIGLGVGSQLMSVIYIGALMGLQKQVRAGLAQFIGSILKNIGVLLILMFINNSLYSFLFWQIACNILLIIIYRYSLLSLFSKKIHTIQYRFKTIPSEIWKYLSGMFIFSILNSLNLQIDKLIASKLFTLDYFGYYSLVSILAQAPVIVATPFILSLFPYMTRRISENKKDLIFPVFKKFSFLINLTTVSTVLLFAFYGKSIFVFWTHNTTAADALAHISRTLTILSFGYLFIAFQQILSYFLLAEGITKYSSRQIAFQLILSIPLLIILINIYGMPGAGFTVLIVQLLGFLYLFLIVKKRLIKKRVTNLLLSCYLLPILSSSAISGFIYIIYLLSNAPNLFLFFTVVSGFISLVTGYYLYNKFSNDKIDLKNLL